MAFFVRCSLERLLHNLGIEVKKASVLIISPVTRRVLVAKGSPALSNTNTQLWIHFGCFVHVLFGGGKKKDLNWKNPESFPDLQKHTRPVTCLLWWKPTQTFITFHLARLSCIGGDQCMGKEVIYAGCVTVFRWWQQCTSCVVMNLRETWTVQDGDADVEMQFQSSY